MNDNQDLLDLCRLNLIEDNVQNSVSPDKDEAMKAIDYKKRALMTRLKHNPPTIASDAMEKHIEANTLDGVYPWIESESAQVYTEDEI